MFPGNDEIYQQILDILEQNENIDIQKKLADGPLLGSPEDKNVKSIVAFIVYPKKPIYDIDDLNRFAEDNLVPLFEDFEYQAAEIKNNNFLGIIPIPGQSFTTVPCLRRIDEHPSVSIFGFPDHEIHYHIILAPNKKIASDYLLPIYQICDKYTIKVKDIKTASQPALA